MDFHYVYVLLSEKDILFYTGYTSDLEKRLEVHNNGEVKSTKDRRPFKLVYFKKRGVIQIKLFTIPVGDSRFEGFRCLL